MGSRICIGLAYGGSSEIRMAVKLGRLIEYLIASGAHVKRFRVSRDSEGSEWIKRDLSDDQGIESFYEVLVRGYYGEADLAGAVLGYNDIAVTVRVVKGKGYFGFLLDLDEEDLLKSHSQEELDRVTAGIVDWVKGLYPIANFDYAFCDEEAELQYPPEAFRTLGAHKYSVAILPAERGDAGSLSVLMNSWCIDGLTPRAEL